MDHAEESTLDFHVDIMDLSQLSFEDLEGGGATEVLRSLQSPLDSKVSRTLLHQLDAIDSDIENRPSLVNSTRSHELRFTEKSPVFRTESPIPSASSIIESLAAATGPVESVPAATGTVESPAASRPIQHTSPSSPEESSAYRIEQLKREWTRLMSRELQPIATSTIPAQRPSDIHVTRHVSHELDKPPRAIPFRSLSISNASSVPTGPTISSVPSPARIATFSTAKTASVATLAKNTAIDTAAVSRTAASSTSIHVEPSRSHVPCATVPVPDRVSTTTTTSSVIATPIGPDPAVPPLISSISAQASSIPIRRSKLPTLSRPGAR